MKNTFLKYEKPLLTVMLQGRTPELAIERIEKSIPCGAEAFGLQVETLRPEFHNPDTYKRIFEAGKGRPFYTTYYRTGLNEGIPDEELAKGLLTLADSGATLCDVVGDWFDRQPDELARDKDAIKKQMELIDTLHDKGAEVLMSSHLYRFAPAEEVLEIALEQQRRGADIVKIVTGAENMDEQIENLRITNLLKKTLDVPFLFLSCHESLLHRRIGANIGCCMYLCVYEHDEFSTPEQPILSKVKLIRDNME